MSDRDLVSRIDTLEAEMIAQRFATHAIIEAFRAIPDIQQHADILYNARTNLAIALEGAPILAAARKALDLITLPEIPSREHQAPPD